MNAGPLSRRLSPGRRSPVTRPAVAAAAAAALLALSATPGRLPAQERFSIEDAMSAPFPSGMTAAPARGLVAWVQNAEGVRNVWVAGPPDYRARRLTSRMQRDGQPVSDLAFTPDASRLVYVRGATPNREGVIANPTSRPEGQERTVRVVPTGGGEARTLGEGDDPAVSPDGETVAFERDGDVWFVSLTGKEAEPEARVEARGSASSLRWSPDGRYLAFVSRREEHSVIGVYDPRADTLDFKDGSVDRDISPAWSPDGRRLAWIRVPSEPKELPFTPDRTAAEPWSVRVLDLDSGEAREVWSAKEGRGSAFRGVAAERQLLWAAGDRLVFPWERTGWVHLYSVPAAGGEATERTPGEGTELTPGEGIVEHVALSADRRSVVYSTNHGDIDRRHLWRVPVDGGSEPRQLTSGRGIEWGPAPLSGGGVAFLASGARDPAHAEVLAGGERRWMARRTLPDRFPREQLVRPRQVIFSASDGKRIHGQLFLPRDHDSRDRRPAVVFMHGGSRRQMLLGWHYLRYYHQAYAMNQWLASKGYVVLSVNYRSGIGYGLEFREALHYGAAGASEFKDIQGAGVYLRGRPGIDGDRIGLWGGSYGGYLTALGLARASDLFAAGVDFHGVHNWNVVVENFVPDYDPTDRRGFAEVAFESSPMADAEDWRSPVLFVHGDDDRNVPFTETVRMVAELRRQDVHVEQLIFPDEVHDFLLHRNWLRAYRRAADFFDRTLGGPGG